MPKLDGLSSAFRLLKTRALRLQSVSVNKGERRLKSTASVATKRLSDLVYLSGEIDNQNVL